MTLQTPADDRCKLGTLYFSAACSSFVRFRVWWKGDGDARERTALVCPECYRVLRCDVRFVRGQQLPTNAHSGRAVTR